MQWKRFSNRTHCGFYCIYANLTVSSHNKTHIAETMQSSRMWSTNTWNTLAKSSPSPFRGSPKSYRGSLTWYFSPQSSPRTLDSQITSSLPLPRCGVSHLEARSQIFIESGQDLFLSGFLFGVQCKLRPRIQDKPNVQSSNPSTECLNVVVLALCSQRGWRAARATRNRASRTPR